jgi:uncharacterized membrane protein HdeD (DUF308 family)
MNGTLIGGLRHAVAQHWWVLLLRGIVSIVLGVMAFVWPGLTLASLVLLYGLMCLVDGVVAIAGGLGAKFWQSVLIGAVSIAAGIVTFVYPGLTAMVLLYLIAFWAIFRGIFDIAAAIEFRKVIEGELLLGLAGLASIIFGILILFNPGAGALSVVWIFGTYALLFGIMLVILSFKLKGLASAV